VAATTEIASKIEERKVAPPINPGLVSIAMLPNDLATLTSLMGICAKIFEEQAMLAAQANDEPRYAILAARQKLSAMFANKLVEFCNMGEPESRDIH
jgi:hypothetical protein